MLWSDVYSVSLFFVLEKIISAVDEVMENTALLDNIKSEKELEQVIFVVKESAPDFLDLPINTVSIRIRRGSSIFKYRLPDFWKKII